MSFLANLFQMDISVARITLYNLTFVNCNTIKYREVALLKILFFFYLNGVEDCMQTRI